MPDTSAGFETVEAVADERRISLVEPDPFLWYRRQAVGNGYDLDQFRETRE